MTDLALPPLQVEQMAGPDMIGGVGVMTARLAGTTRRGRLWVAAVSGSDLHAGRGGFGQSRKEAVMDLFRYLRFMSARVPR